MSSLASKLAEVGAKVERIAHDTTVSGADGGYKATSIDAIADLTRPLLAEQGIAVIPDAVVVERHDEITSKRGAQGYHVVLRVTWRVTDGETDYEAESTGASIDYSDKAYNKAHTFARKNLLVAMLNLSTGDNPEGESPEAGRRGSAPAPAEPPKPAARERPLWRERFEEMIALGRTTGMSEDATKETMKAAGITRPLDLERDDFYANAHDAVTGFIGGKKKPGGEPGGMPEGEPQTNAAPKTAPKKTTAKAAK